MEQQNLVNQLKAISTWSANLQQSLQSAFDQSQESEKEAQLIMSSQILNIAQEVHRALGGQPPSNQGPASPSNQLNLVQLQNELQRLRGEHQELGDQYQLAKAEREQLRGMLTDVTEAGRLEVQKIKETLHKSEAHVEKLSQILRNLNELNKNLEGEVEELKAQTEIFSQQILSLDESIEKKTKKIYELNLKYQDLEKLVFVLKFKNKELKKKISDEG